MVERHYSLGKAAELLGVSKSTIRLWRKQGKIRFARLPSGHWRIPESEILRLLYGFKPKAKHYSKIK